MGDHTRFSKLTGLLGTVPGWQISFGLRQAQRLLSDPAQPACPGLWGSLAQKKKKDSDSCFSDLLSEKKQVADESS